MPDKLKNIFRDLNVSGDEKAEEKKVEKALFFVVGERITLLHEAGVTIEADVDVGCGRESESGPWSEIPKGEGLWIWEGIPGWHHSYHPEYGDEGGEPIYDGRGTARRPTSSELAIIALGPIEQLFGESQLPPKPCLICKGSLFTEVVENGHTISAPCPVCFAGR